MGVEGLYDRSLVNSSVNREQEGDRIDMLFLNIPTSQIERMSENYLDFRDEIFKI